MEIKKLGVVGAGAMGNGIAQVAAQIGCDVIMRDIKDEFVERGMKSIDRFLSRSVEKGKLEAKTLQIIKALVQFFTNQALIPEKRFELAYGCHFIL